MMLGPSCAPPFAVQQPFPPFALPPGAPQGPSGPPPGLPPHRPAMPTNAALAQQSAPAPTPAAPPRPTVRLQAPDPPRPAEPTPAPLRLPPPEQLGVRVEAGNGIDWNDLHASLLRLNAVGLHFQRPAPGVYHVRLQLPTAQPERTFHVEAEADTEAEAVRLALERAEQWAARNR
jgi:hypothetical protein